MHLIQTFSLGEKLHTRKDSKWFSSGCSQYALVVDLYNGVSIRRIANECCLWLGRMLKNGWMTVYGEICSWNCTSSRYYVLAFLLFFCKTRNRGSYESTNSIRNLIPNQLDNQQYAGFWEEVRPEGNDWRCKIQSGRSFPCSCHGSNKSPQ